MRKFLYCCRLSCTSTASFKCQTFTSRLVKHNCRSLTESAFVLTNSQQMQLLEKEHLLTAIMLWANAQIRTQIERSITDSQYLSMYMCMLTLVCAVANQLQKAKYSRCKENESPLWQQSRAVFQHRYNAARHNIADTGPTSTLWDDHILHSYRLNLQVKC